VDDIIEAYSSADMHSAFLVFMQRFKYTHLGPLRRGLGCDITQDLDAGVVTFGLTGYIRDVARRLDITLPEKPVVVPATSSFVRECRDAVSPTGLELESLAATLNVKTGIISFVASTARPDVAWHSHFLSSAVSRPTHALERFADRVLLYLLYTAALVITYRRSATFHSAGMFSPGEGDVQGRPHMATDSNLGTPRSISGWLFMLAGAAVSWRVMAQVDPAISSGEAEFYALSTAIAAAVHVRHLLAELTYVWVSPMHVFTDSRAARLMVQDGNATHGVRHIDLRWWFANHHVESGHVFVAPVRGNKNPSNGLTKLTTGTLFLAERAYMLGVPADAHSVLAAVAVFHSVSWAAVGSDARARAAVHIQRIWRGY
jgi:hypothetical protein